MLGFCLQLGDSQYPLGGAGGVRRSRIAPTTGRQEWLIQDSTLVDTHQLVTRHVKTGEFQIVPNVLGRFT
jgi:hypothetical protein